MNQRGKWGEVPEKVLKTEIQMLERQRQEKKKRGSFRQREEGTAFAKLQEGD